MPEEDSPSPGTPPAPDRSHSSAPSQSKPDKPPAHVQPSTTARIAALADDFSRLRSQDSEDSEDMSRQATATEPVSAGPKGSGHGHGIGIQQSPPSKGTAGGSPRGNPDAEMSADERESTGSDEVMPGGDRDDGGQSKIIDRIMKSFCSSLDSKIATLKDPKARPAVKEEAFRDASFAVATTVLAKDAASSVPLQKRASKTTLQGWSHPVGAQPQPTTPASGISGIPINSTRIDGVPDPRGASFFLIRDIYATPFPPAGIRGFSAASSPPNAG
ncbi:hypothetical protein B0I37DRAFT_411530 [Chaetomium sp. MPI-CAGE-AT-0009]|nr:hypothetical protein B0I37DRAFT_411530 [Chaetomium sp. MPI-CAGE-AT-0009]